MKHLILFLLMGTAVSAYAQKSDQPVNVPAAVTKSFQQQYPKATGVKWKMKDNEYKAEFEKHDVWYDATGKVVKQKEDIKDADLPAVIKQAVQQQFAGYKIHDADKHTTGTAVTYKLELKKDTEKRDVTFSADGKVLKNELDKDKKDGKKKQ
jgi:outer membrane protein OmpA-like peptidoglycan-associated protein